MRLLQTTLRAVVGATASALVLTGCSVYEMPLPGGTDVGDQPIEVTAEFRDVLDLVPQTTVKVNDVSVGKITDIDLAGETAVVTMQLPNDIVFGRILLSWVDPTGSSMVGRYLFASTEWLLAPVRRMLPQTGMMDFSGLVVLLILSAIWRVLRAR